MALTFLLRNLTDSVLTGPQGNNAFPSSGKTVHALLPENKQTNKQKLLRLFLTFPASSAMHIAAMHPCDFFFLRTGSSPPLVGHGDSETGIRAPEGSGD